MSLWTISKTAILEYNLKLVKTSYIWKRDAVRLNKTFKLDGLLSIIDSTTLADKVRAYMYFVAINRIKELNQLEMISGPYTYKGIPSTLL
jgi:hypothetical protein